MPFIDLKLSKKITEDKKKNIKTKLGGNISLMHKPESYLMVGIDDGYNLYFAGKKLENGAYVHVNLFGNPNPTDCNNMTAAICTILKDELDINGENVYVAYSGISNWGWNGENF